jgi:hypothetical protein
MDEIESFYRAAGSGCGASTGTSCVLAAAGRFQVMPPLNSRPTMNLVPFLMHVRTDAVPAKAIRSARNLTNERSGRASGTWSRMPDSQTSTARAVVNRSCPWRSVHIKSTGTATSILA